MLPGMLSRLIQAQLCIVDIVIKIIKKGHDIPVPGSLATPAGSRRCDKAPQMPPRTLMTSKRPLKALRR